MLLISNNCQKVLNTSSITITPPKLDVWQNTVKTNISKGKLSTEIRHVPHVFLDVLEGLANGEQLHHSYVEIQ